MVLKIHTLSIVKGEVKGFPLERSVYLEIWMRIVVYNRQGKGYSEEKEHMKRQILAMAGVVLLTGCEADAQGDSEEPSSTAIEGTDSESDLAEDAELTDNESDSSEEIDTEDTAFDSKDELSDNQNMPLNVSAFDSLIDKETFANEAGYQAWMDYKDITSAYTLGDLTGSTEDEGSTLEEMDQLIDEILDRNDVIRDVIEITETDKMISTGIRWLKKPLIVQLNCLSTILKMS